MKRRILAEAIATAAPDHVVITSLGTAGRAWRDFGGANPTFYGSDPMGAAPDSPWEPRSPDRTWSSCCWRATVTW
ncbi:hypothetical protein [Nocardioides alcanivorans]|uniref:hypothetical protein n=1 Tax=Nocardioides alcanivorans TaxID=2897352 RepID=UPI001F38411D|nr:hypothetical protein [Nocardioides alcanivorans]